MDNMESQNQSAEPKTKGHGAMWTVVVAVLIVVLGAIVFYNRGSEKGETKSETQMQGQANGTDNDGDDHGAMAIPSSTPTPTPSDAMTSPTPTPSQTSAGAEKTITVEGSNFKFSPSQITVNKGDKVKIVFNNTGGFHDFVIDEFNVKTSRISAGASETVSFVADKTGSFEYYCSVGEHRAMGMKGTLVVQ